MTYEKTHELILDTIGDSEISHAVYSRRDVLKKSGMGVTALALSGMPIGLAMLAQDALAQTSTPTAALTLALKLEYLESAFYTKGYNTLQNAGTATNKFTLAEDSVVSRILAHEVAHVTVLQTALGSSAPTAPAATSYDWSGGGGSGTGPFATIFAATPSKVDFFKLAQLFEDLGVRAYTGALPSLAGNSAVTTALQIRSMEARHAAMIRILRNPTTSTSGYTNPQAAWPAYSSTPTGFFDGGYTGSVTTAGTQAYIAYSVYGPTAGALVNNVQGTTSAPGSSGEDNLSYKSSFVRYQTTTSSVAEAFDEPMSSTNVMTIAGLFGVS